VKWKVRNKIRKYRDDVTGIIETITDVPKDVLKEVFKTVTRPLDEAKDLVNNQFRHV
jgi:hypothetical protein